MTEALAAILVLLILILSALWSISSRLKQLSSQPGAEMHDALGEIQSTLEAIDYSVNKIERHLLPDNPVGILERPRRS
jgi:hypothetical protein